MLTPLVTKLVTSLIPLAEPAGPTFDSAAILTLILSKILPVIIAVIGVVMLMGIRKQRMSGLMEDVAKIVIIGVVIVGGTLLITFGGTLAKLIIN